MARRKRPGRPRNNEREISVVAGKQLATWPFNSKGSIFELVNIDDLLSRKGFQVYREMLNDEQIKACLAFKKVLITGRAWEIAAPQEKPLRKKPKMLVPPTAPAPKEPGDKGTFAAPVLGGIAPQGDKPPQEETGGPTPEDKKVADFVTDNLHKINFNRILRDMLSALEWGFSVGEILWEVDDYKEEGPKVLLKDIKHRDPEFVKIDSDLHGNIEQFRQLTQYPPHEITLPVDKVMHFAYNAQFSNHYGTSDLRAAYRAWWSKKFAVQFYNVFLERFGAPLMMMKYPQGSDGSLKAALQNILSNLQSKSDILVPEGVIVELIESTRAGTAKFEEAIALYDIAISRAILVPALLGMGVDIKRGSDSQSRLHLRVLMKVAQDLASDIEDVINNKLIPQMVDPNFDVTEYPKFRFRDYGEYEAIEIVEAIVQLFNAGILELDGEDTNYARSVLGMPIRKEGEEDEVLRAMPPPLGGSPNDPNATGDGPQQGNDRAKKGVGAKSKRPDMN